MLLRIFSCHCSLGTGTGKVHEVNRRSISVQECFPYRPRMDRGAPSLVGAAEQTGTSQARLQ